MESLAVHELVRDFPELLQVLESAGVLFQEVGGRPLALEGGSPPEMEAPLEEKIAGAVAWRGRTGGGEGP